MKIINTGPHWVRVSEIVAVVDDMDSRYAPPQRKSTRILLRNGVWLTTDRTATEILNAMTGGQSA